LLRFRSPHSPQPPPLPRRALRDNTMAPKEVKKLADKLTDAEKKKIKQENKAKANPAKAAAKKEKTDAKRERRKASGSTKTFS
jgi:predicted nucleotidyltransferase